jgi:hypothetical protein
MKIKITRPTIFRKQTVMPGQEFDDVSKAEALDLVAAGKAVVLKDPTETEDTALPMDTVETSALPESEAAEDSAEAVESQPKRKRSKP